jgi:site-specific DNA recombinase
MSNDEKNANGRAVAYVRVSSKRQVEEGVSLEAQVAAVKQYASLRGLTLAEGDIFIEQAVTAANDLFSRKEGQKMRRLIYGDGVKHVITPKMDRIFRDVQDLLSTIDEMERIGVGIHFLEFNGTMIDTSSAMGRFFITVIGGLGELERRLISERTKAVMDHKKATCKVFCHDIFGWDRVGEDLVPNWQEQDVIDYMRWAYNKKDRSSTWIANHLNGKGIKGKRGGTWKASMVLRTMRYEFHAQRERFDKPDNWGKSAWHDSVDWS